MNDINSNSNLHTLSDENLLPFCKKGNPDAFAVLISRYLPLIQIKTSRYNFSSSDLEDFKQECWLGFLSSVRKFEPSKNVTFKTFATVCIQNRLKNAVNNAIKHKNKNKFLSLNSMTNEFDVSDIISLNYNDLESSVLEKDFECYLKHELNTILTKSEKAVFDLFLAGHTYSIMAKKLNVNEKSIDNALQRIRKKIKMVDIKS